MSSVTRPAAAAGRDRAAHPRTNSHGAGLTNAQSGPSGRNPSISASDSATGQPVLLPAVLARDSTAASQRPATASVAPGSPLETQHNRMAWSSGGSSSGPSTEPASAWLPQAIRPPPVNSPAPAPTLSRPSTWYGGTRPGSASTSELARTNSVYSPLKSRKQPNDVRRAAEASLASRGHPAAGACSRVGSRVSLRAGAEESAGSVLESTSHGSPEMDSLEGAYPTYPSPTAEVGLRTRGSPAIRPQRFAGAVVGTTRTASPPRSISPRSASSARPLLPLRPSARIRSGRSSSASTASRSSYNSSHEDDLRESRSPASHRRMLEPLSGCVSRHVSRESDAGSTISRISDDVPVRPRSRQPSPHMDITSSGRSPRVLSRRLRRHEADERSRTSSFSSNASAVSASSHGSAELTAFGRGLHMSRTHRTHGRMSSAVSVLSVGSGGSSAAGDELPPPFMSHESGSSQVGMVSAEVVHTTRHTSRTPRDAAAAGSPRQFELPQWTRDSDESLLPLDQLQEQAEALRRQRPGWRPRSSYSSDSSMDQTNSSMESEPSVGERGIHHMPPSPLRDSRSPSLHPGAVGGSTLRPSGLSIHTDRGSGESDYSSAVDVDDLEDPLLDVSRRSRELLSEVTEHTEPPTEASSSEPTVALVREEEVGSPRQELRRVSSKASATRSLTLQVEHVSVGGGACTPPPTPIVGHNTRRHFGEGTDESAPNVREVSGREGRRDTDSAVHATIRAAVRSSTGGDRRQGQHESVERRDEDEEYRHAQLAGEGDMEEDENEDPMHEVIRAELEAFVHSIVDSLPDSPGRTQAEDVGTGNPTSSSTPSYQDNVEGSTNGRLKQAIDSGDAARYPSAATSTSKDKTTEPMSLPKLQVPLSAAPKRPTHESSAAAPGVPSSNAAAGPVASDMDSSITIDLTAPVHVEHVLATLKRHEDSRTQVLMKLSYLLDSSGLRGDELWTQTVSALSNVLSFRPGLVLTGPVQLPRRSLMSAASWTALSRGNTNSSNSMSAANDTPSPRSALHQHQDGQGQAAASQGGGGKRPVSERFSTAELASLHRLQPHDEMDEGPTDPNERLQRKAKSFSTRRRDPDSPRQPNQHGISPSGGRIHGRGGSQEMGDLCSIPSEGHSEEALTGLPSYSTSATPSGAVSAQEPSSTTTSNVLQGMSISVDHSDSLMGRQGSADGLLMVSPATEPGGVGGAQRRGSGRSGNRRGGSAEKAAHLASMSSMSNGSNSSSRASRDIKPAHVSLALLRFPTASEIKDVHIHVAPLSAPNKTTEDVQPKGPLSPRVAKPTTQAQSLQSPHQRQAAAIAISEAASSPANSSPATSTTPSLLGTASSSTAFTAGLRPRSSLREYESADTKEDGQQSRSKFSFDDVESIDAAAAQMRERRRFSSADEVYNRPKLLTQTERRTLRSIIPHAPARLPQRVPVAVVVVPYVHLTVRGKTYRSQDSLKGWSISGLLDAVRGCASGDQVLQAAHTLAARAGIAHVNPGRSNLLPQMSYRSTTSTATYPKGSPTMSIEGYDPGSPADVVARTSPWASNSATSHAHPAKFRTAITEVLRQRDRDQEDAAQCSSEPGQQHHRLMPALESHLDTVAGRQARIQRSVEAAAALQLMRDCGLPISSRKLSLKHAVDIDVADEAALPSGATYFNLLSGHTGSGFADTGTGQSHAATGHFDRKKNLGHLEYGYDTLVYYIGIDGCSDLQRKQSMREANQSQRSIDPVASPTPSPTHHSDSSTAASPVASSSHNKLRASSGLAKQVSFSNGQRLRPSPTQPQPVAAAQRNRQGARYTSPTLRRGASRRRSITAERLPRARIHVTARASDLMTPSPQPARAGGMGRFVFEVHSPSQTVASLSPFRRGLCPPMSPTVVPGSPYSLDGVSVRSPYLDTVTAGGRGSAGGVETGDALIPLSMKVQSWREAIQLRCLLQPVEKKLAHSIAGRLASFLHMEAMSAALEYRMRQLRCLHAISSITADPSKHLGLLLQEIAEILPSLWGTGREICVRIAVFGQTFTSSNYRHVWPRISSAIRCGTGSSPHARDGSASMQSGQLEQVGRIEVCQLRSPRGGPGLGAPWFFTTSSSSQHPAGSTEIGPLGATRAGPSFLSSRLSSSVTNGPNVTPASPLLRSAYVRSSRLSPTPQSTNRPLVESPPALQLEARDTPPTPVQSSSSNFKLPTAQWPHSAVQRTSPASPLSIPPTSSVSAIDQGHADISIDSVSPNAAQQRINKFARRPSIDRRRRTSSAEPGAPDRTPAGVSRAPVTVAAPVPVHQRNRRKSNLSIDSDRLRWVGQDGGMQVLTPRTSASRDSLAPLDSIPNPDGSLPSARSHHVHMLRSGSQGSAITSEVRDMSPTGPQASPVPDDGSGTPGGLQAAPSFRSVTHVGSTGSELLPRVAPARQPSASLATRDRIRRLHTHESEGGNALATPTAAENQSPTRRLTRSNSASGLGASSRGLSLMAMPLAAGSSSGSDSFHTRASDSERSLYGDDDQASWTDSESDESVVVIHTVTTDVDGESLSSGINESDLQQLQEQELGDLDLYSTVPAADRRFAAAAAIQRPLTRTRLRSALCDVEDDATTKQVGETGASGAVFERLKQEVLGHGVAAENVLIVPSRSQEELMFAESPGPSHTAMPVMRNSERRVGLDSAAPIHSPVMTGVAAAAGTAAAHADELLLASEAMDSQIDSIDTEPDESWQSVPKGAVPELRPTSMLQRPLSTVAESRNGSMEPSAVSPATSSARSVSQSKRGSIRLDTDGLPSIPSVASPLSRHSSFSSKQSGSSSRVGGQDKTDKHGRPVRRSSFASRRSLTRTASDSTTRSVRSLLHSIGSDTQSPLQRGVEGSGRQMTVFNFMAPGGGAVASASRSPAAPPTSPSTTPTTKAATRLRRSSTTSTHRLERASRSGRFERRAPLPAAADDNEQGMSPGASQEPSEEEVCDRSLSQALGELNEGGEPDAALQEGVTRSQTDARRSALDGRRRATSEAEKPSPRLKRAGERRGTFGTSNDSGSSDLGGEGSGGGSNEDSTGGAVLTATNTQDRFVSPIDASRHPQRIAKLAVRRDSKRSQEPALQRIDSGIAQADASPITTLLPLGTSSPDETPSSVPPPPPRRAPPVRKRRASRTGREPPPPPPAAVAVAVAVAVAGGSGSSDSDDSDLFGDIPIRGRATSSTTRSSAKTSSRLSMLSSSDAQIAAANRNRKRSLPEAPGDYRRLLSGAPSVHTGGDSDAAGPPTTTPGGPTPTQDSRWYLARAHSHDSGSRTRSDSNVSVGDSNTSRGKAAGSISGTDRTGGTAGGGSGTGGSGGGSGGGGAGSMLGGFNEEDEELLDSIAGLVGTTVFQRRSHHVVLSMLPETIAQAMIKGEQPPATSYDSATILFSDIVGFTTFASRTSPMLVIQLLQKLYTAFDAITEELGLYKVETIGDAYMVAGGLPQACPPEQHAVAVAVMALRMQAIVADMPLVDEMPLDMPLPPLSRDEGGGEGGAASGHDQPMPNRVKIRIGIHTGPVVTGVVGRKMPHYCLFGDTVNTASRMESTSAAGRTQVSSTTAALLQSALMAEAAEYPDATPSLQVTKRGTFDVKGKGMMTTYFVEPTS